MIGRKKELTTTGLKLWMHRKHPKSEGEAELLTFALAMLSTKINCRNYVLFGYLFLAVAPFLLNSDDFGSSNLSENTLT